MDTPQGILYEDSGRQNNGPQKMLMSLFPKPENMSSFSEGIRVEYLGNGMLILGCLGEPNVIPWILKSRKSFLPIGRESYDYGRRAKEV